MLELLYWETVLFGRSIFCVFFLFLLFKGENAENSFYLFHENEKQFPYVLQIGYHKCCNIYTFNLDFKIKSLHKII